MADMTLEEALAAATVDEELVTPVNEVLLINPETRTINVPDSEKLFGARQDMDVERKYFKCPRIVGDNIDLFEHEIFINYVPSKQDGSYDAKEEVQCYWCRDLAVEGDFVTFSWKLSENVTRSAGYIAFAVYAKTIDEYGNLQTKWHTTIAIGNVLDTLPDGEEWVTVYPDIVMQLLERMDEVEKNSGNGTSDAVQYIEQTLTEEQQIQARTNIGAASTNEVNKLSEDIATKASAIKEKASGEVIVVTDSDEAKPLGLAIDGKSEQNQYSGKQLLNLKHLTQKTSNGITFTPFFDENGELVYIEADGTSDGSISNSSSYGILNAVNGAEFMNSFKGKEVIVSGSVNGSASTYKLQFWSEEKTIASYNGDSDVSIIPDSSNWNVAIVIYKGQTVSKLRFYPMIRLASIADDSYEPFVGGIPSPNPSYPQEIRNIGVYDEASGKYAVEVKGTGKNWLQNNATSKTDGGVDFIVNDDKSVTINGVSTADVYLNLDFMASGIPTSEYNVVTETEMVASFDNKVNGIQMAVGYFDESGKAVNMLSVDTADRTFIYPKTAVKAMTYLYIQSGKTFNNVTVYPMIRPVGTDESYEPWKKPITATVLLDEPLRKGDKAYWNGGSKLRIDRHRDVATLDSNAKYTHPTTWTNACAFFTSGTKWNPKKVFGYAEKVFLLCEKLSAESPSYISSTAGNSIGQGGDNGINVYISVEGITTEEDLKTFLAENPIEVEYELATPITEEIDIDLDGLSMFYPTTVISNDCNANMEVTYIADTKAYIDKKFAELATVMV